MVFSQPFIRSFHRNGYFPAESRSQHFQVQSLVSYYLPCIPYGEYITIEAGKAIIIQAERFQSRERGVVCRRDLDGYCRTSAADLFVMLG